MPNIHDYLLWRGDLDFKASTFNIIDDMILARFSYLPFHKIQLEEIETIESIAKKFKKFENKEFAYKGDKELISLLGQSNRFKNMHITDFKTIIDTNIEKQFAAITIHIDDSNMYISYNGTDDTIVGWKEDFNLSFMENIPSQIEGLNYLKTQAQKNDKSIRIGGHSKGGNIAIYSAINSTQDIQNRIISVVNYDGPGFNEKIANSANFTKMLDRIFTYMPQESIVGRLLEHKEQCTIVQSNEKGIFQHDIFSWQVIGTKPIILNKLTDNSNILNKTINAWLKESSIEQRKIFVDTIFELLYSTKASTISELKLKNFNIFLKNYNNINDDEKKVINEMISIFIDSIKKSIIDNLKEKKSK